MRVRIYTTTYCGYCYAAKRLMRQRGIDFEEIDCTSDRAARDMLVETTGQRTVPQIFFDEVPIGGYDELSALDRSGELPRILRGEQAPTAIT